jgi:hypothetical protein
MYHRLQPAGPLLSPYDELSSTVEAALLREAFKAHDPADLLQQRLASSSALAGTVVSAMKDPELAEQDLAAALRMLASDVCATQSVFLAWQAAGAPPCALGTAGAHS